MDKVNDENLNNNIYTELLKFYKRQNVFQVIYCTCLTVVDNKEVII